MVGVVGQEMIMGGWQGWQVVKLGKKPEACDVTGSSNSRQDPLHYVTLSTYTFLGKGYKCNCKDKDSGL